jgi:hypothetical protein
LAANIRRHRIGRLLWAGLHLLLRIRVHDTRLIEQWLRSCKNKNYWFLQDITVEMSIFVCWITTIHPNKITRIVLLHIHWDTKYRAQLIYARFTPAADHNSNERTFATRFTSITQNVARQVGHGAFPDIHVSGRFCGCLNANQRAMHGTHLHIKWLFQGDRLIRSFKKGDNKRWIN